MATKNITEKTELDEVITTEETNKVSAAKKKVKKYAPEDFIECRSVTGGELILVGAKSKLQYTWADYGDTAYVEYQDDIIKVIVQAASLTNEQAAELLSIVMENSINDLIPEIQYIQ